ncbi:CAP domain-containing protein [Macrococcus equi]|uniref:CAP domain-containing protein n=1 Tax=Macrococcus equi TaxID=3395462 RepID=UPI0039BEA548
MKLKFALATSLLLLPATTQAYADTAVSAIDQESASVKYQKATSAQPKTLMTQSMVNDFNAGKLINTKKLNLEFVKLVNQNRKKNGVAPIVYNAKLQSGANIRAKEQAATRQISHTRPNGTLFNTAFTPSVRQIVKAENVAFTYYNFNAYTLVSEKYVAQKLYQLWFNSSKHRNNMLNKSYKGTAIAFKYANVTGAKYTYGYGAQIISK